MNNTNYITVERVLNVVNTTYSTPFNGLMAHSLNVETGHYVSKLAGDIGIETNILCNEEMKYEHSMFAPIGGITIDSNTKLFDELKGMI